MRVRNKRIMDALQDVAVLPHTLLNILSELKGDRTNQLADPFHDKSSSDLVWQIYRELKKVRQLSEYINKLEYENELLRKEIFDSRHITKKSPNTELNDSQQINNQTAKQTEQL